jgi:drug/metabolite transporter (DMT)-like permease
MDDKKAKKTAGALDVRNIIGMLMAVYGVILVLLGIFSDSTAAKTGDVNANLYAGLGLLAIAAVFFGWARLRPIVVPQDVDAEPTSTPGEPH